MATALPDDGRIITCDVDPDATSIARRYMDESGHGDKIEIRLGPALETIESPGRARSTSSSSTRTSRTTRTTTRRSCRSSPTTGSLIADNVLWSGRVVEDDGDESTQAIKAFNEHVRKDSRVVSVMLTVRDGMTLVQKR